MSPSVFLTRLVGLLVAVAGGVLAWGGFLVPVAGARGVDLLARGAVANVVVAGGIAGIAFVVAGLAVLIDRGRGFAVSVGGSVLVAAVFLLAVGTDSTSSVLGVAVVALGLLFAGASVGRRSTP
ncbi:hypothetical protein [Halobellus limi]|uniref:Uncharacterized protein n=1 Tax=Halobellus limi TaxID=699433 RepID=A0A1H5WKC9_9EURY|nr:hypothetical protein [Halobellus limi]QCC46419.1 hypothetical protein DV707_01285 [Halobellus limi]SEF99914.1 hypothetical protein SAMN04488133_1304 [Halobellus limi]